MDGEGHDADIVDPVDQPSVNLSLRLLVRTGAIVIVLLLTVSLMSTAAQVPADAVVPWLAERTSGATWLPDALSVRDGSSANGDQSDGRFDRLDAELDRSVGGEPSSTTVQVDMTSTEVTVTVRWTGPDRHPLLGAVLQGAAIDIEGGFVAQALATVDVTPPLAGPRRFGLAVDGGTVLSGRPVLVTAGLDGERSTIVATWRVDRSLTPLEPGEEPLIAGVRETRVTIGPPLRDDLSVSLTTITINKPAADAVELRPLPDDVTSTKIVFDQLDAQSTVRVNVVPPQRSLRIADRDATTAGGAAVDWAGERRPVWIRGLAFEVLVAVPFLLALTWLRRSSVSSRTRRAIELFAVLQILSSVGRSFGPIAQQLGDLLSPSDSNGFTAPDSWYDLYLRDVRRRGIYSVNAELIVAQLVLSLGWPIAVLRSTGRPKHRFWRSLGGISAICGAAGVLVVGLQNSRFGGLAVLTAGLMVAVAVLCWLLVTPFLGWRRGLPVAVVAAALSLVLATISLPDFRQQSGLPSTVTFVILAALALPMVGAFVRGLGWAAAGTSMGELFSTRRRRLIGWVLALPVGAYVLLPRRRPSDVRSARLELFELSNLAFSLRSLLALALVAVVVRELWWRPANTTSRLDDLFWPFAVITTVIIYPASATFWFVPLLSLLGLAGLWWLCRRDVDDTPPLSLQVWATVTQVIIDVRRLQRSLRTLQRRGLEKAADGDRKLAEIDQTRAELEQRVAHRMIAASTVAGAETLDDLEKLAAKQPPGVSPWQSAKVGAMWSFVVGLPWIVVYWRGALLEEWSSGYLALGLANDLIRVAAVWTLLGFVVGYFFRAIPGPNPIVKGLIVGLGVVGPWVVYSSAYSVPLGFETFGERLVWVVLVLAHMVFVGLALDASTIRRSRLPGNVLVELRGLRPIVGYGSALVAALGGVVTAVLTASASTVLAAGLSFLSPDAPSERPGPDVAATTPQLDGER